MKNQNSRIHLAIKAAVIILNIMQRQTQMIYDPLIQFYLKKNKLVPVRSLEFINGTNQ